MQASRSGSNTKADGGPGDANQRFGGPWRERCAIRQHCVNAL